MYRPTQRFRDRAGPLAGVIVVHLALAYALLHLSGADVEISKRADLAIFDVAIPPEPRVEPPPPVEKRVTPEPPKPRQNEGSPSAANIKSKAAPVVVSSPSIVLPPATPITVATTPSTGVNATSGAATGVGPGAGAGGNGDGSGKGGSGSGDGGASTGLGEARARLATPMLGRRDFPPRMYDQAPRGGAVDMVLRVGADGVPLSCRVMRSFGDTELDALTCRIAVARLRFTPSRDKQGRPIADFFGYRQQFNTRF
jgi:periplasmic protein TonB